MTSEPKKTTVLPAGYARGHDLLQTKGYRNPDVNHYSGRKDECRGDAADQWLKEQEKQLRGKGHTVQSAPLQAVTQPKTFSPLPITTTNRMENDMAQTPVDNAEKVKLYVSTTNSVYSLGVVIGFDVLKQWLGKHVVDNREKEPIRVLFAGELPRVIRLCRVVAGQRVTNTKQVYTLSSGKSLPNGVRTQVSKIERHGFLQAKQSTVDVEYRIVPTSSGKQLEIVVPDHFWNLAAQSHRPIQTATDLFDEDTDQSAEQPQPEPEAVHGHALFAQHVQEPPSAPEVLFPEPAPKADAQPEPTPIETTTDTETQENTMDNANATKPNASETMESIRRILDQYRESSGTSNYDQKISEAVTAAQMLNELLDDPELNGLLTAQIVDGRISLEAPVVVRKKLL